MAWLEGIRARGTLAAGVAAVLVIVAVLNSPPAASLRPITATDGSPLPVPSAAGVQDANWQGHPVVLFVVPESRLADVDAAHGYGAATRSVEVPGHPELRMFAISGISTYRGCTVGYLPTSVQAGSNAYDGNQSPPDVLLDRCHQGRWDPFWNGHPLGGPAPTRLAILDARVVDGELEATGFDGPVGATVQSH